MTRIDDVRAATTGSAKEGMRHAKAVKDTVAPKVGHAAHQAQLSAKQAQLTARQAQLSARLPMKLAGFNSYVFVAFEFV